MKIILSPAKRLNEKLDEISYKSTVSDFLEQSEQLIKILKKKTKTDISELMKLSSSLSELNYSRFQVWKKEEIDQKGKPCIFMFEGDAYKGLNVKQFSEEEIYRLNNTLFILSGLYGVLRPLDKILPYRLEMGTKLENKAGKNLYEFWKKDLTDYMNKTLKGEVLINLASKEYSSVIDFKNLELPIVQIDFLQEKEGKYKNIAIFSKRARGLMTAFIVKNNIKVVEELKAFDSEKYYYNNELSKENHLVFTR